MKLTGYIKHTQNIKYPGKRVSVHSGDNNPQDLASLDFITELRFLSRMIQLHLAYANSQA